MLDVISHLTTPTCSPYSAKIAKSLKFELHIFTLISEHTAHSYFFWVALFKCLLREQPVAASTSENQVVFVAILTLEFIMPLFSPHHRTQSSFMIIIACTRYYQQWAFCRITHNSTRFLFIRKIIRSFVEVAAYMDLRVARKCAITAKREMMKNLLRSFFYLFDEEWKILRQMKVFCVRVCCIAVSANKSLKVWWHF